jgi:hypothetical protein
MAFLRSKSAKVSPGCQPQAGEGGPGAKAAKSVDYNLYYNALPAQCFGDPMGGIGQ